jgi:hypothetical protein
MDPLRAAADNRRVAAVDNRRLAAVRDWFPLLHHGGFALDVVANVVTVEDRVFSARFGEGLVGGIRRKPAVSRAFGGRKYIHPQTRLLTASCETFVQVLFDSGASVNLRTSLVRFILPPDNTPVSALDHGTGREVCDGGAEEGREEVCVEAVLPKTEGEAEGCGNADGSGSPAADPSTKAHTSQEVPSSI